jgi:hypothetical protein
MSAVSQALQVMAIGLPTMFGVIILFMLAVKLLFVIFPGDDKQK